MKTLPELIREAERIADGLTPDQADIITEMIDRFQRVFAQQRAEIRSLGWRIYCWDEP